jgi:hypothetical protein
MVSGSQSSRIDSDTDKTVSPYAVAETSCGLPPLPGADSKPPSGSGGGTMPAVNQGTFAADITVVGGN